MLKAQSRVRRVVSVPRPVPRRSPIVMPNVARLNRQSIVIRPDVPIGAPSERS
jgi:hypothetical protein